jgi:hypothetical protein
MLKTLTFLGLAALAVTAVAALTAGHNRAEPSPEPDAVDLSSRKATLPLPQVLRAAYPLRFSVN